MAELAVPHSAEQARELLAADAHELIVLAPQARGACLPPRTACLSVAPAARLPLTT